MTRRGLARRLIVASAVAGACAYYNGLYNANRLASDARRAEREGRTGEARALWSQAAVKAESVSTRYPKSKYRDDALVLQGMALARIDACSQATSPLALAADSSPDPVLRRRARVALARCRLAMLEPDSVMPVVAPLIGGADSGARATGLLLRGQAALALGDAEAAVRDLERSNDPDAPFPLAVALAATGRRERAVAVLQDARERPYQETQWLGVLDTVGRHAPGATASLVAWMVARKDLGTGERARLLVDDGERWAEAGQTDSAAVRFRAAARLVPDSVAGRLATTYLAVAAVRRLDAVAPLAALLDTLRRATQRGGTPAQVGSRFVLILQRVTAALDSAPSDLALFVGAEDVRDTLAANLLAVALFREVAIRYPESIIAPKALLAAAALSPDGGDGDGGGRDSLIALVRRRYPSSVYVAALRGEGDSAYQAVEDSLRALLAAGAGRAGARPGGRPRGGGGSGGRPDE